MLMTHGVCLGFTYAGVIKTCGKPLRDLTAYAYDHKEPLWCGGNNEPDNWQPLCTKCHAEKTALEASIRAKADSQGGRRGSQVKRRKSREINRFKGGNKIASRSFQKAPDGYQHFGARKSNTRIDG